MLQFRADLHLDAPAVDAMTRSPYGEVGRWLARKGGEMAAGARAQVGVRSGRLRNSIAVSQERTVTGQRLVVSADAVAPGRLESYALDHHEGTLPHMIAAPPGKTLVFPGSGGVGRTGAKVVKHPGTPANRFLSDQLPLMLLP